MRHDGQYRLRINADPRQSEHHCYVVEIDETGECKALTADVRRGLKFGYLTAQDIGQRYANWLKMAGYADSAKRLRIVPATGGMETAWRPIVKESSAASC